MTRKALRKRFHELAVKEALGEASGLEVSKLERYQQLLRVNPHPEEIRCQEASHYKTRMLLKEFGRALRQQSIHPAQEETDLLNEHFWELV